MTFIQNLISDEIIYALGWTMIHSLWQGMLIAFLLAFGLFFLQKRSSRLRYEVASLSLFLILISSICTFIWLYDKVATSPLSAILLFGNSIGEGGNVANTPGFFQAATQYFNQHLPLIVTVWLTGVAFFLLRLMGGLAYIQRLKFQHNRPLGDYWQQKLKQITERLPLQRPVKLLESSLINVPMVLGYFKPVILLPIGAVNNLTVQEVEAILAHELAHVHRNDYLLNIILSFIEVLFYYHPAVWFISANIRNERENCADDIAVQLCGSSLTYAKALVSLQELEPSVPAFAMPFSSSKNQLLNRIQRILHQPQTRSNIRERLLATGMLLIALLLLSVSTGEANDTKTKLREFLPLPSKNLQLDVEIDDMEPFLRGVREVKITTATIPVPDTIPPHRTTRSSSHQTIITDDKDGKKVEVELRDGEITKLKVDGKKIPASDYAQYEEMVNELRNDIPKPPAPPVPPAPVMAPRSPRPNAAPLPPAPPSPPGVRAPSPPSPPAPPAPPTPRFDGGVSTIIITTDEEGSQQVINIDGEGTESMDISIDDDKVYLNGELLEDVDEIYVVEGDGHQFSWSDREDFNWDGKEFKLYGLDNLDSLINLGESVHFEFVDGSDFEFDINVEEWNIEVEESMEELQESLREMKEKERELMHKYKQEVRDAQREELKERQEEMREQRMEMQNQVREQMEERRVEMQELRETARQKSVEARAEIHRMKKEIREAQKMEMQELEQHLIKDGLIKESGDDFTLHLDNKKLRVNGKRQSAELHKKYVEIFRKKADAGHDFNININRKN